MISVAIGDQSTAADVMVRGNGVTAHYGVITTLTVRGACAKWWGVSWRALCGWAMLELAEAPLSPTLVALELGNA